MSTSSGAETKIGGGPSNEFRFAKSVAAPRAVYSSRTNNPYSEPLAEIFAGPKHMNDALELNVNLFPERPIRRNEVGARVSRHMIIDKMLCDAVVGSGSSSNCHEAVPDGPRQVVSLGA